DERREDGAGGVGEDDVDVGLLLAHELRGAGEGAAGADAADEGVGRFARDAVDLLPDLRGGVVVVRLGVVLVAELVDIGAVGRLTRDALGDILVVVGVPLLDIGAGEDDLGAHGAEVLDLALGHLVGDDDDEVVAALPGDERERDAGVAGGP